MPVTSSAVHSWLSHRSKSELYALCGVLVISAWLLCAIARHVWLCVQSKCNRNLWCSIHLHLPRQGKYLLFVFIPRVFSWLDIATFHQAIVVSILVASNLVALTLGADSLATTQRRAGSLAVIHMIPLCTGFNFGFPANLLLLDRQALAWAHRWIGRLFLIHSIIHGSLIVSSHRLSLLANPQCILPLTAVGALVLTAFVTWAPIRQRYPQVTLSIHHLLIATAVAAIAYHLAERKGSGRWYLLGAILLWSVFSLVACIGSFLAQRPWKGDRREVILSASNGLLLLDILAPPDWSISPGQYLQLWMPYGGARAFFQLPMFYVAICDREDKYPKKTIRMLARPRSGLTAALYRTVSSGPIHQPVTILGPYGRPTCLNQYGTVLFVVEDIGLFRVLSLIEMLVNASVRREAMVRKLYVLWEHESIFGRLAIFSRPVALFLILRYTTDDVLEYPEWWKSWRQRLLDKDHPRFGGYDILSFRIFRGQAEAGEVGTRVRYYQGSLNVKEEIPKYLDHRLGAMAVAVCTNPNMRRGVRKTVRLHFGHGPRLLDLDLGPYHSWSHAGHQNEAAGAGMRA